jgi:hypothetical protein
VGMDTELGKRRMLLATTVAFVLGTAGLLLSIVLAIGGEFSNYWSGDIPRLMVESVLLMAFGLGVYFRSRVCAMFLIIVYISIRLLNNDFDAFLEGTLLALVVITFFRLVPGARLRISTHSIRTIPSIIRGYSGPGSWVCL